MGQNEDPVVVVGAGIIGTAIAWELQRRGRQLVLIDRDAPGRGASFGNMASIAVSEFMPASRPSVWAQMPSWLLDPEGPVRLRPSYLPRLLPWFVRFLSASRPSRLRTLEAAGAALSGRVYQDLEPMLEEAGLAHMLSAEGCISLYADDAELTADREHIELMERFAIPHEVIGGNRMRDLEPALNPSIRHALLLPQNRTISDPYGLVTALAEQIRAKGGRIETGEVVGLDHSGWRVSGVRLADGRHIEASEVVLCAGAYTGNLSRLFGEPIPLETERGYSTQIMEPGISLKHSIIWPAKAFMISPTAGGIRIGGTVEMAGLDAAPNYARARITVKRAKEALPDLKTENGSEWMGHRPAFPDTVPVIGPSGKVRGVYYATGHGHLGLTLAATTARLLADVMTGVTPPVDMRPYSVNRFRERKQPWHPTDTTNTCLSPL